MKQTGLCRRGMRLRPGTGPSELHRDHQAALEDRAYALSGCTVHDDSPVGELKAASLVEPESVRAAFDTLVKPGLHTGIALLENRF